MGFENKYPYTDFHEMNLDWILEVVKGIETEWPEFRTEMQTAWQQYQDNLTGEGGEWPTFRDEMTQDFDDFIHLFIDEFDNMHAYTVGDYVVQDGQVYKCEALPSPSHALPIEFDEYTWLRISNGVINQFSHEIMAIESSVKTFVERMVPEYSDQEYYNKDMIVRKASTFAPTFPYDFYIAKQLITPETWTPSHWERVNSFAQAINDVCAINKQEMQDQYDQFLEDYQRTFGVVQTRGSSTTDVMSQKAVSDELQAHDDMIDNLIKDIAPVYDSTKAYKIGNLLTYLGKQYEVTGDDGVAPPVGTLPTDTNYFTERPVSEIIDMIKAGTIPVGLSDMAKNLTPYSEDSGAIQDTPFISQETGTGNNSVIVTTGDTAKQLEKLGNAVVYNQLNSKATNIVGWTTGTTNNVLQSNGYTKITKKEGFDNANTLSQCSAIEGHKVLFIYDVYKVDGTSGQAIIFPTTNFGNLPSAYGGSTEISTTKGSITYHLVTIPTGATYITARFYLHGYDGAVYCKSAYAIDLTQWFNGNDNIPADLLANPSHFSWYYNGELTYNAGNIKHGEGVKLVCTRGRNLWNGTFELGKFWNNQGQYVTMPTNNYIASADKIRVVPNTTIAVTCVNVVTNGLPCYIVEFDRHGNYIRASSSALIWTSQKYVTFAVSPDTYYVSVEFYRATVFTSLAEVTPTDVTPYYTPAEGGEGYDQHYDYEEPDIIDTGSEQLGAFDKKTPDGVITRKSTSRTFDGTENWKAFTSSANGVNQFYLYDVADVDSTSSTIVGMKSNKFIGIVLADRVNNYGTCYIGQNSLCFNVNPSVVAEGDVTAWKTWLANNNVTCEYLSVEITEQGTSFRQYAGINDYGIMYWLDENDELVSIPQGCKIQYPVNYKGFIDDAYMYTDGDATALAKNESITDSALNARGYYKMQDLLTTLRPTLEASLKQTLALTQNINFNDIGSFDLSTATWRKYSGCFYTESVTDLDIGASGEKIVLCTKYNTTTNKTTWTTNEGEIYVQVGDDVLVVRDSNYSSETDFANSWKNVLFVYKKKTT